MVTAKFLLVSCCYEDFLPRLLDQSRAIMVRTTTTEIIGMLLISRYMATTTAYNCSSRSLDRLYSYGPVVTTTAYFTHAHTHCLVSSVRITYAIKKYGCWSG